MLVTIPQRQLVDEDRPQRESPRVRQSLRWYLSLHVEDPLELPVEVLAAQRTQLVEDASHLHPIVGMRVAPVPCRHEDARAAGAQRADLRGVVVAVTEHEAR